MYQPLLIEGHIRISKNILRQETLRVMALRVLLYQNCVTYFLGLSRSHLYPYILEKCR